MTTTDPFTTAAMEHLAKVDHDKSREWFDGFVACTRWARDHLAAQEPTDAECLAVLNVAMVPLGEPPKRNGLADWNPAAVERVRAALSDARAARRVDAAWKAAR